MTFLKRCNGYSFNQVKLSANNLLAFNAMIQACRAVIKFPPGDYHRGSRFGDNGSVLGRIQSAIASEEEFAQDPEAWIMDALRDCAGADHWYTFEKEWD